jgi:hypothetical protein
MSDNTPETWVAAPPSDPQLRQIGEQILAELQGSILKALGNATDPQRVPLSDDPAEQLFARRLRQRPAERVRRAAERARSTPRLPGVERVNLSSAVPVPSQLASARPRIALTETALLSALQAPPPRTAPSRTGTTTGRATGTATGAAGATVIEAEQPTAGLSQMVAAAGGTPIATAIRPGAAGALLAEPLRPPGTATAVSPEPASPRPRLKLTPYEGVRLRLIRLACVKTTSGAGYDEIALAGTAVSANGSTRKIKPFMVSEKFKTGVAVDFGKGIDMSTMKLTDSGPQQFVHFKYSADDTLKHPQAGTVKVGWPRMYHVTFLLAEIDNGGFPAFANDVFELVRAKVAQEVAKAVAAALVKLGPVGAAIGAAVGALTSWVLGVMWGWLISLWEDDVFPPITVALTRTSGLSRFQKESAFDSYDQEVWWKGFGGHYTLKFDWQVTGGPAGA